MRTTLTLDDDLLRMAKRRATESGLSVSEVVNRALRRAMASEPHPRPTAVATITFGMPGAPFPHAGELAQAEARLDDEYLLSKLATS